MRQPNHLFKNILLVLVMILMYQLTYTQDRPYRHIKTNEYLERIKKKDKAEKKAQHDLEKWLKKIRKRKQATQRCGHTCGLSCIVYF